MFFSNLNKITNKDFINEGEKQQYVVCEPSGIILLNVFLHQQMQNDCPLLNACPLKASEGPVGASKA